MIYQNKETKWIIVLSFFVISNLIINLLYQKMGISWFIVLHGMFSLGSIIALLFLLKNISKLVHELKASNMKLQTIFETMDIAIWYHDIQSNNLLITSGIEKIYGHSIQEFQENHKLWQEVVHPKDKKIIDERLERLKKYEEVTSIYRIMKPDGNIRWIKDKGIPLLNSDKEMIEFR